ncbi:uncharacterized protein [Eurosta solidaginis]|uniref:uncharacterized protein n=1 Tax=Eurosta solidaginis TaxID=178769 RepID=UPI003531374D
MIPWIRERSPSPVFGRVISREPVIQPRLFSYRGQYFGSDIISSPRLYGAEEKSTFNNHNGYGSRNMNGFHRPSKYRYEGTNGSTANEGNEAISNLFKVHGSFQRLKELIWTERAKELKQQRKSEELAVRASVLKEIASGRRSKSPYQHSLVSESSFLDENRNPEGNIYKHLNDGHKLTNRGQSYFIEEYNNRHKNIKISGSSSKKKKFDNKILLHSSKSHYDSSRKATNNSTYNKLRKIFSNLSGITRALKLCNYMSKNLYRKHTESCLESFSQFYFPNGGSDTITKANNFIKYDFVPGTFYIRERNSALFEGNSTFEKRKHAISSSQEVRRHSQMADKAWQEKRMPERTFQKFNWYTFAPAINSETKDYYKIMKRHMEVESNSSLANTSVERLGIFDFSTNESGTYPSKTSTMSE